MNRDSSSGAQLGMSVRHSTYLLVLVAQLEKPLESEPPATINPRAPYQKISLTAEALIGFRMGSDGNGLQLR